jgi:hypothetical protein
MEHICQACRKQFVVDNLTIHCMICDRWYCSDIDCWMDYNDEFPDEMHCNRGNYAQIEVENGCDQCNHVGFTC